MTRHTCYRVYYQRTWGVEGEPRPAPPPPPQDFQTLRAARQALVLGITDAATRCTRKHGHRGYGPCVVEWYGQPPGRDYGMISWDQALQYAYRGIVNRAQFSGTISPPRERIGGITTVACPSSMKPPTPVACAVRLEYFPRLHEAEPLYRDPRDPVLECYGDLPSARRRFTQLARARKIERATIQTEGRPAVTLLEWDVDDAAARRRAQSSRRRATRAIAFDGGR